MPRVKLGKRVQIKFLDSIRKEYKINWSELAEVLNVHYRCLSDWSRGEYTLPEGVFKKCIRLAKGKVEIPPYKILPDFWSVEKAAKKGGLVVAQKYGGPGTPEGCKKGGLIAQARRRSHPELYQHCNIRRNIFKPKESSKLAELFGIILGDGGITDKQVIITLNKENDKEYISYVCDLIEELFKIKPAVYKFNSLSHRMVVRIAVSNMNLVDFLLSKGLKKGNKVKQQVDVPKWIKDKMLFSVNCLRGLVDTDGCTYIHKHKSHNCQLLNIGLQLSNKSVPILSFAEKTLLSLNFTPKLNVVGVNLYRESETFRYAKKIRFSNPRHSKKLEDFFRIKYKERCRSGRTDVIGDHA